MSIHVYVYLYICKSGMTDSKAILPNIMPLCTKKEWYYYDY